MQIPVAVENSGERDEFIAVQQVSGIRREAVSQFIKHISRLIKGSAQRCVSSLAKIGKTQNHDARVSPHKSGVVT